MDWPLTAVLTGIGAAVCGAGIYGVILVRSVAVPTPKAATDFAIQLAPGVDPATFFKEQPGVDILPPPPLAPLTPDTIVSAAEQAPVAPKAEKSPAAPKAVASPAAKKLPPATSEKAEPTPAQKKVASIDHASAAKASPPPPPPPPSVEVEQWRVVATSKASMFNLGGHIDKAGMVDGMATPHLKEALQKHKNFGKLPPAIRAHIMGAASIDLNKLAPYSAAWNGRSPYGGTRRAFRARRPSMRAFGLLVGCKPRDWRITFCPCTRRGIVRLSRLTRKIAFMPRCTTWRSSKT